MDEPRMKGTPIEGMGFVELAEKYIALELEIEKLKDEIEIDIAELPWWLRRFVRWWLRGALKDDA